MLIITTILCSLLFGIVFSVLLVIGMLQSAIHAAKEKETLANARREEITGRTAERQRLAEAKQAEANNKVVLSDIRIETANLVLEKLQKEEAAKQSFTSKDYE